MTNREAISLVRKGINESNADSTYTNKFIYSKLKEQAKWLIPRDAKNGKIFRGTSIFQTARCIPIISVSADKCCSAITCCEIHRTRNKIDDIWEDASGPIVKSIFSIDGTTSFVFITASDWQRKLDNPYNKKNDEIYVFYDEGYFWFPDRAPKKVNIQGFFIEDITNKYGCEKRIKTCVRFLDKRFSLPEYLAAEAIAKVIQSLASITKRIPEDDQIDKNPNIIP